MTKEIYLQLLLKSAYNRKDVMLLAGCSHATATKVMKICREAYNGAIMHRDYYITSDSFFAYQGTTRKKELELLERN